MTDVSILDSPSFGRGYHSASPDSTSVMECNKLEREIDASSIEADNLGLSATRDSRAIVRLFQCAVCSHPLSAPIILPCGNTICRKCQPQPYRRPNITYPAIINRQFGFKCPFEDCVTSEHSVADCGADVTLSKAVVSIARQMDLNRSVSTFPNHHSMEATESEVKHVAREGYVSLLVATYTLAETGLLPYSVETIPNDLLIEGENVAAVDQTILSSLKEAIRPELECQVCYAIFLDPVTSACGHTFCKTCLERVLDHSSSCPVCRAGLPPPHYLSSQPINKRLTNVLAGFFSDQILKRPSLAEPESGSFDTPIFVCTISFPTVPTFLHIFEPRYRLMIRRVIENGSRRFGMVLYNQDNAQQELQNAPFLEYGTMLNIINVEFLPDGRSLIETFGTFRFRVKEFGYMDGYTVAKIHRIDDIPLAQEEMMEAFEIAPLPGRTHISNGTSGSDQAWMSASTQSLAQTARNFIAKMRTSSAPWLHERVLQAYGEPPEDPATFPFWLASVFPVDDSEKYRLLMSMSVRERLKIVVGWIKRIEGQRWYSNNNCTIF